MISAPGMPTMKNSKGSRASWPGQEHRADMRDSRTRTARVFQKPLNRISNLYFVFGINFLVWRHANYNFWQWTNTLFIQNYFSTIFSTYTFNYHYTFTTVDIAFIVNIVNSLFFAMFLSFTWIYYCWYTVYIVSACICC